MKTSIGSPYGSLLQSGGSVSDDDDEYDDDDSVGCGMG